MRKLLLIIVVLLSMLLSINNVDAKTFSKETGKEINLTETTNGYMAFDDELVKNIEKLKENTVYIIRRVYQLDGTIKYYHAAGYIVDERHILTVGHAVTSTLRSDIYYGTYDGEDKVKAGYMASVEKTSKDCDLALIKIDAIAPDLKYNHLKFSNTIYDNDSIYTVGHPDSDIFSITQGNISYLESEGYNDISCIELNINLQSGNSGGFVINKDGELLGMIFSTSVMIQDIGYMISKEDIQKFME